MRNVLSEEQSGKKKIQVNNQIPILNVVNFDVCFQQVFHMGPVYCNWKLTLSA